MIENTVEILLVEDNISDAELTIRALKKQNLANNLIHLKNGAEAENQDDSGRGTHLIKGRARYGGLLCTWCKQLCCKPCRQ